jgi:hypothetical protein
MIAPINKIPSCGIRAEASDHRAVVRNHV